MSNFFLYIPLRLFEKKLNKTQPYNLYLTKPNQNWTAKPNQTKPNGYGPQIQIKIENPYQTKPNQNKFTKANLT